MLKYIKIPFLMLLLVFNWGCTKDEGNYNYHAINEIKTTGIEASYTVYTGDSFKITPNLNATLDDGKDADHYTYQWVVVDPINDKPDFKTIIATTKDFNGVIKLPPTKYTAYYLIKDKETGVTWQTRFELNVVSSIYEGWLVLGDVDGKARLDMVSIIPGIKDPRIINDVLDVSGSALKLSGKAVNVYCFKNPVNAPLMYGIYVTASESGTSRIDENTFAWAQSQNIAYESIGGALPTNFGVDFMKSADAGENLIYSKGNIYSYYRVFQYKYSLPQNKVDTEDKTFYAAPFIAENFGGKGTPVFFDKDKHRFIRYSASASVSSVMPNAIGADATVDWNNTNSDLIYMITSSYNDGENFAVLKNLTSGKFYLLRFSRTLFQTYYKEILNAPDFDKASKFAVSPDSGYLFYSVGGKVYEYDNGIQSAKLMLEKGNEEITYLGFNPKATNFDKKLIVGSYGTTGKLELFTVPPVNGALVLTNTYDGLCKIVDVAYRAR